MTLRYHNRIFICGVNEGRKISWPQRAKWQTFHYESHETSDKLKINISLSSKESSPIVQGKFLIIILTTRQKPLDGPQSGIKIYEIHTIVKTTREMGEQESIINKFLENNNIVDNTSNWNTSLAPRFKYFHSNSCELNQRWISQNGPST